MGLITLTFIDDASVSASPVSAQTVAQIKAGLLAAVRFWGRYLDVTGNLEIRLEIKELGGANLASGTAVGLAPASPGGPLRLVTIENLLTGVDVTAGQEDATVVIDLSSLGDNRFYFDPDPETGSSVVPAGQFDFVTVMVHELGHALGFKSLLPSSPGEDRYPFDTLVSFDTSGRASFTGSHAMTALGAMLGLPGPVPVPLRSDVEHLTNSHLIALAGVTGSFALNEIVRGAASGATATVARFDAATGILVLDVTGGTFRASELVSGQTSGASGTSVTGGLSGLGMMDPFITPGTREYISPLDIAILQDMGLPVNAPTTGADAIYGFGGAGATMAIDLLAGNDQFIGLNGNDTVLGGAGNDTLDGALGNDKLTSGAGSDVMLGGAGDDVLEVSGKTGVFHDVVSGAGGVDTLVVDLAGVSGPQDFVGRIAVGPQDLTAVMTWTLADGSTVAFDSVEQVRIGGVDWRIVRNGQMLGALFDLEVRSIEETYAYNNLLISADLSKIVLFDGYFNAPPDPTNSRPVGNAINLLEFGLRGGIALLGLTPSSVSTVIGSSGLDYINIGVATHEVLRPNAGLGPIRLDAGGGDDVIAAIRTGGADRIDGGDGNDLLFIDALDLGVDVSIVGGAGRDTLAFGPGGHGRAVTFTLNTGIVSGFENLVGSGSNDVLIGDAGANDIRGGAGDDRVEGGDGDDVLFGDIAVGSQSTLQDVAQANSFWDLFEGHNNRPGSDVLFGGAGNDRLYGAGGEDVLDGGAGADTLDGGEGRDVFVLRPGDGALTTASADRIIGFADGTDFLGLDGGLTFADLAFEEGAGGEAANTIVRRTATGEILAVVVGVQPGAFSAADAALVRMGSVLLTGTSGNDVLIGGLSNDTLSGGAGSDVMLGGAGDDVLEVSGKTGVFHDVVSGAGGVDTLVVDLAGVSGPQDFVGRIAVGPQDLTAVMTWTLADGSTVAFDSVEQVRIGGVDWRIVRNGQMLGALFDLEVRSIEETYAYNNLLISADLSKIVLFDGYFNAPPDPTNSRPVGNAINLLEFGLRGGIALLGLTPSSVSTVIGSSGLDYINIGVATHEVLRPNAGLGPIRLDAGGGDDVIAAIRTGGADRIDGGDGNDLLFIDALDLGVDVSIVGGAGRDTLAFGPGGHGRAVTFTLNTGIVSGFENLVGSGSNDVLIGDAGANDIRGGAGDDRVEGGDGDDVLFGDIAVGSQSTLQDVAQANSFWDLFEGHNNRPGSDVLFGGAGNDRLYGAGGEDVLDGGAGADTLDGGEGRDVFVLRPGDGALTTASADRIIGFADGTDSLGLDGGLTFADLAFEEGAGGEAANTIVRRTATGEILAVVVGVQPGAFSAADAALVRMGSVLLTGTSGNDVLIGGLSNDTLSGGAGSDVMLGGAGDDVLEVSGKTGVFHDVVSGAGGVDTLVVDLAGVSGPQDFVGRIAVGPQDLTAVMTWTLADGSTVAFDSVEQVRIGGVDWRIVRNGQMLGALFDLEVRSIEETYAYNNLLISADLSKIVLFDGYFNAPPDPTNSRPVGNAINLLEFGLRGGIALLGLTPSSVSTVIGSSGLDYINIGVATHEVLRPNAGLGPIRLDAGGGDDVIAAIRTGGADRIDGGDGNDLLFIDALDLGVDVSIVGGAGRDTLAFGPGGHGRAVTFTLNTGIVSGFENLVGSGSNDVLIGDAGANDIRGGAGDDRVEGGDGDDVLFGDIAVGSQSTLQDVAQANSFWDLFEGHNNRPGSDVLFGGAGNDRLYGAGGEDVLDGGAGADTLDGGEGADQLGGGSGDDALIADLSDAVLNGGPGYDTVSFAGVTAGLVIDLASETVAVVGGGSAPQLVSIENAIGGSGADTLSGDAFGNRLEGGAGNDTLNGRDGDDTLLGGAGNDALDGGTGFDVASFEVATLAITASLASGVATGEGTDTLAGIEGLRGGSGADTLVGDGVSNTLAGGLGADQLTGGGGVDFFMGTAGELNGDRILDFVAADDAVYVTDASFAAGAVTLTLAGADTTVSIDLTGDGAADVAFTLAGNFVGQTVQVSPDGFGGTFLGIGSNLSLTVAAGQSILRGGAGQDTLTGLAGDDFLLGGLGNDTLEGGAGNDRLAGGAGADLLRGGVGEDTVDYSGGPAGDATATAVRPTSSTNPNRGIVMSLLDPSRNTGLAAGDIYVDIENIRATNLDDDLEGNNNSNKIEGLGGDDILRVTQGVDLLDGGNGFDQVFVFDAGGLDFDLRGARVVSIEALAFGAGASAGRVMLTAGLAGPGLASALAVTGVAGSADAIVIEGGSFDASAWIFERFGDAGDSITLRGGADADVINGSTKADTMSGEAGADVLVGGLGADTLDGGLDDDWLDAGEGDDLLVGGAGGINTLLGGSGTDLLTFAGQSAGVYVDLSANAYSYSGGYDGLSSIEGVLGGSGADTLFGNSLGNLLRGGQGSDTLVGRGGSDTLVGEAGDDWIVGEDGDDLLEGGLGINVLIGGDGIDLASYASQTANLWIDMPAGVYSAAGVWDVFFQSIEGVLGGSGNDSIFGNALDNTLRGGAGDDALIGGAGNDRLEGGAGFDWIVGGEGNDRLIGGEGVDVLTGGAGADTFDLGTAAGWDVAFDFNTAEDRFSLGGLSWLGFLTIDADGDGQTDDTLLGYAGGNFVALNASGLSLAQWNALVDAPASAAGGMEMMVDTESAPLSAWAEQPPDFLPDVDPSLSGLAQDIAYVQPYEPSGWGLIGG